MLDIDSMTDWYVLDRGLNDDSKAQDTAINFDAAEHDVAQLFHGTQLIEAIGLNNLIEQLQEGHVLHVIDINLRRMS